MEINFLSPNIFIFRKVNGLNNKLDVNGVNLFNIFNDMEYELNLYWLNSDNKYVFYWKLNPDTNHTQKTYFENEWLLTSEDDRYMETFKIGSGYFIIVI